MKNEQLLAEYKEISKKMRYFEATDDNESRNKLVPRIRELNAQIDWGYKVGQVVDRWAGKTWVPDVILSIYHNEFRFRSVTMPHQLIRPKTEQREQLTLF